MSQSKSAPIAKNVAIICPALRDPSEASKVRGFFLLSAVLAPLAEKVFIITGNFFESIPYDNVRVINVTAPMMGSYPRNLFSRAFRFFSTELALSGALIRLSLKLSANLDTVFFLSGEALLIPILISKLLRKKISLVLMGSLEREMRIQKNPFHKLLACLKRIDLALTDKIIVGSPKFVEEWNLGKHRNKIWIATYPESALFTYSHKFRPAIPLAKRANVIAYIRRLGREKGALNFAQAIPEDYLERKTLSKP